MSAADGQAARITGRAKVGIDGTFSEEVSEEDSSDGVYTWRSGELATNCPRQRSRVGAIFPHRRHCGSGTARPFQRGRHDRPSSTWRWVGVCIGCRWQCNQLLIQTNRTERAKKHLAEKPASAGSAGREHRRIQ